MKTLHDLSAPAKIVGVLLLAAVMVPVSGYVAWAAYWLVVTGWEMGGFWGACLTGLAACIVHIFIRGATARTSR